MDTSTTDRAARFYHHEPRQHSGGAYPLNSFINMLQVAGTIYHHDEWDA